MKEYPKIETLFNRDKTTFNVTDEYRLEEFKLIPWWHITEKIHGTNIRVHYTNTGVEFGGRQSTVEFIPGELVKFLSETFTYEKMHAVFGDLAEGDFVTLYGEGCGPGIQKGGGNYCKTKTFVLFDVLFGKYWLEPENIKDVAGKLGIQEAPVIGVWPTADIVNYVKKGFNSQLALANTGLEHKAEGVIARTVPGLLTCHGTRLVWKLKTEDYRHGNVIKQDRKSAVPARQES